MRKECLFALITAAILVAAHPAVLQAQSQAQSQSEGRPQGSSQSQSQAVSQGISQSQAQSPSQATSQAISQQSNSQIQDQSKPMPPMSMPVTPAPSSMEPPNAGEGATVAMQSMESRHMDMGAHMKMTALRPVQPGDAEKAGQIIAGARSAAEQYTDYNKALADGYQIFHPEVPQKQYHFTNYRYAFDARYRMDPLHPTSLLYEKNGGGYKLIGVMYTAPKDASEDDLNARVPLSIAQWHAHVNICLPPGNNRAPSLAPNSQFGFRGSISTREACDAAGGRFMPQIFGWMVHVYPFETNPEDIWSVERQHDDHAGHMD